jgi:hypothetical protein
MASVLFESTDTDAPVLNKDAGSLLNVLKACLVDGYGSKASLGWETVFYDAATHKWVFRQKNSKANRPYIRLVDDNGYSSYYHSNHVYIYDFMYDIDKGVNLQPISIGNSIYSTFIKVASRSSNTPVAWKVIGDDYGFWFLVRHWEGSSDDAHYGKMWVPHYLGDYISWSLEYKYPFIWLGACYGAGLAFQSSYCAGYLLRNLDNSVLSATKYAYLCGVGGHELVPGNTGYPNYSSLGIPYFGGTDSYHPIMLSLSTGWSPRQFIGRLPALSMLKRADKQGHIIDPFDPYVEVVDTSTEIMTFQCRYLNNDPTTVWSCRLSIVIGEGFRNVF